ncbi:DUF895 domain membrane protein [Podochytrium sp. JEL0797]|nr:DUF895 domain membrane protein [Podochytrium sp. JEL0797]
METTPLLPNGQDLNHRLSDIRILGASFFFIFASQSTIQTLSSTVFPSVIAFNASGTFYISFALFNLLVASAIVERIGVRPGLFFAALTYTANSCGNILALMCSGNVAAQNSILIPTAILNGLGASIIWTCQGVYVAKCSTPNTIGRYTGVFFGFMWGSGVMGPIFTSTLLQLNLDKLLVFEIVAAISVLGPLLLGYLWQMRPEPSNPWNTFQQPSSEELVLPRDDEDKTPKFLQTAQLCLNPSMLLLMPMCYAIGFETAFYSASLPLFIKTASPAFDLSMKLYLRATLGVILTSTAFAIGPLIDRVGPRPLILTCFCIHLLAQSLLYLAHPFNNIPILVVVYACIGVSNGILYNSAQKLVGTLFPVRVLAAAYSTYRFHTSAGTAVSYFLSGFGLDGNGVPNMRVWAPFFVGLLGVAVVCVFRLPKVKRGAERG